MLPESLYIYHLAEISQLSFEAELYAPPGLAREGFIHCSRWAQLPVVAATHYPGRADLKLLELDTSLLESEVRYEALGGAPEPYPHVYGPIPENAIVDRLTVSWPEPDVVTFARRGFETDSTGLVMRRAGQSELESIARMYHALREDEGETNAVTLGKLHARLRDWLAAGHEAWLFELPRNDGETHSRAVAADSRAACAAYALVDRSRSPVLIRHLYVRRGLRRRRIGTAAVSLIGEHYHRQSIDVETLANNTAATRFWHSLGFVNRTYGMRREAGSPG